MCLLNCSHKTFPLPGGHAFSLIMTIFKLVRDIHITNAKHVTSRVKKTPPWRPCFFTDPNHYRTQLSEPGVCRTDGQPDGRTDNAKTISLRLWRGITRAQPLCEYVFVTVNNGGGVGGGGGGSSSSSSSSSRSSSSMHYKNAVKCLGSHVFQAKVTIFQLIQDITGTNHLSKFHEDRKINIASRVLTKFYYSHIWKNAPAPGGHVFQPTNIIFKLVQDIIEMNLLTKFHEDWTINVASRVLTRFCYSHIRKNAPPLGSHVFQANVTIFELIQDIIKTNLLTKFHEDWTINANVDVAQRTTHDGLHTKGDHKSSP
ncbi:hypothetical protein DPMN_124615 [Dreissena polymorpha]|uniref:Uncharacterized protein n=1 Tax=Dreissena polymorpha TaxID=45954 RepID=A0A9D4GWQ3_DREPO|nr:hypothetical protein DPMN_124615 [Dreissena polymorpha]